MLHHEDLQQTVLQLRGVQAAALWRGYAKAALRRHDLGALAAVNACHDEGSTP